MISSTAGLGWENGLDMLGGLLDTASFEQGVAWVDCHSVRSYYALSKKAVCAYVARQGYPFLKRGVRINATQPGPTDTPLARANARLWLSAGREYREAAGIDISRPEEQAYVLAFLCSSAASYVTGISIVTDGGPDQRPEDARLPNLERPQLHEIQAGLRWLFGTFMSVHLRLNSRG
jgi:NAD(P)-dependent dehydrogenase (short-subunit alcohol dehydrogenase family)